MADNETSSTSAAETTLDDPETTAVQQDSVQTAAAEPDRPGEDDGSRTATSSRSRRVLLVTLVVLVLLAATGTGYLAFRPSPPDVQPSVNDQGGYTPGSLPSADAHDAIATTARALPTVLGYDYRTLDDNRAQDSRLLTDQFAVTFRQTFDASVTPLATKQQAVTRALVRAVGLINQGPARDQITCLAYVDQLLVSSTGMDAQKPAQVSQNRVVVHLKRPHGQWLIDGLDPF